MDTDQFLTGYLRPSADGLDKSFILPLPEAEGLKPCGRFIVQGELENTVSTNIITKYDCERTGIRLVEVYKNTQERVRDVYIRLVGTLSMVRRGYLFLFLDAAVSNVSPRTASPEAMSTRVAVHMPQADSENRSWVFDELTRRSEAAGIACGTRDIPGLPDFWGPLWHAQVPGFAPEMISTIRGAAWESYKGFCTRSAHRPDFDYQPVQIQMVLKNAAAEHQLFQKMGLSVPVEAQAAFFSVLVAGV